MGTCPTVFEKIKRPYQRIAGERFSDEVLGQQIAKEVIRQIHAAASDRNKRIATMVSIAERAEKQKSSIHVVGCTCIVPLGA